MSYEKINNPTHYEGVGLTAIDVIEAHELNFSCGSALKYILRAGKKPGESTLEDLNKALWYVQRELNRNLSITPTPSMSFKQVQSAFSLPPHLNLALSSLLSYELSDTAFHLEQEIERIKVLTNI